LREPCLGALYYPAADVRLIVEITSPGNAYVDRALKPQLYGQAGIRNYLRVELKQGRPTGVVHILDGDTYREVERVEPGSVTRLIEPFPLEADLVELAAHGLGLIGEAAARGGLRPALILATDNRSAVVGSKPKKSGSRYT